MSSVRLGEGFRARVDTALLGSIAFLIAIGTLAIVSAASPLPFYSQVLQKHFLALAIGTGLLGAGLFLNYQVYQDQAKVLYALALAVLTAVLILGHHQRGSKAWLHLGAISIQPAEIARILTILVLAAYLDRFAGKIRTFRVFAGAFVLTMPIIGLVLLQPDFSSVLVLFPVVMAMLFCAGARVLHLAVVAGFGLFAGGMPLLWTLLSLKPHWVEGSVLASLLVELPNFGRAYWTAVGGIAAVFAAAHWLSQRARVAVHWSVAALGALLVVGGLTAGVMVDRQLKGYQRKRIEAFLVPEADPRGSSYNAIQAQIALGSGGLTGRGVFSGTQSQLGFLPERHTDFIFAVIGEELGLLGSMSVLGFYLLLIGRIVSAAKSARDRFGYLVGAGLASLFGFYLLINTGMCLGLVPIAGLQLPLVSYGGSSLVASLWALSIVVSIHARRYSFF